MGKVVITGGSGYVGFRLGCSILREQDPLADQPQTVVLFDTRHPHDPLPAGMEVYVGDICSPIDLSRAFQGASIVFHVASYGMSGLEGMLEDKIQQINVTGTQNVIDACVRQGVGRLVYVSSYNAVFDGVTPIVAGTEATTHYVTRANCSDPYSLTKAVAEQLVLGANGTKLSLTSDGQEAACLRTCALRPAAIWGPGEQRHMTRIVRLARQGYLRVMFGEATSLVDFVHVDNLVAACVLAARALEGEAKAGGKAYFVNDDQPVNNFAHFQQIMVGLGYKWPTVRLPYWLVHLVALLLEVVAAVVRNITGRILIVPLLTRTEVAKCAITHYAKCDLAREELGYSPLSHGFEATIEWYKVRKFGPIAVPAEVQAVRMVRNVRLCLALFMVTLIVIQWRMKSQVSLVTA